jgi:hypothetical protein
MRGKAQAKGEARAAGVLGSVEQGVEDGGEGCEIRGLSSTSVWRHDHLPKKQDRVA